MNITQAKIRDQENIIKDLEFRNSILEARVKDLEKKQKDDIYDKYFPKPNPTKSAPPTADTPSNSCSSGTHMVLSCCTCYNTKHQQKPCSNSTTSDDFESVVRNLSKQMEVLKNNNTDLKVRLDTLNDITLPQSLRAALSESNCRCSSSQCCPALAPSTPYTSQYGPSSDASYQAASKNTANGTPANQVFEEIDDAETSIDNAIHDLSTESLN